MSIIVRYWTAGGRAYVAVDAEDLPDSLGIERAGRAGAASFADRNPGGATARALGEAAERAVRVYVAGRRMFVDLQCAVPGCECFNTVRHGPGSFHGRGTGPDVCGPGLSDYET